MNYVYESPDHGQTVYRREVGQMKKEIISTSAELEQKRAEQDLWIMWRDILSSAKNNPALHQALDRARIIYELSKNND